MASATLETKPRYKGKYTRYRPLTRVIDLRNPDAIGLVQGQYVRSRDGVPIVIVRFGKKPPIPVPAKHLKMVTGAGRPAKEPPQAREWYKRLEKLKGWSEAECDRQSALFGLTLAQIIEALED